MKMIVEDGGDGWRERERKKGAEDKERNML